MAFKESPWKGTVMGGMLLTALGLLFIGPFLAEDQILFPAHTATYLPWRDDMPKDELKELEASSNRLMADKLHMFHPELIHNKRSLLDGRLPLWDPYTLGGIPHLAQGLPSVFQILNMGYLFMDPENAYALTAFLQIVLASLFMLLFLRSLEIHHFSAFVGGLVFGFSGWMLIHLHYYMITGAAMWLPLMLLGTERLMKGGKIWWIFALALGTFQTLCAGFPQIAFMNMYLATIYALVRAAPYVKKSFKTALGRLGLAAGGLFIGILLSGVQLLPSADVALSDDSTRKPADTGILRSMRLDPECLAVYVAPDLFGHPKLEQRSESPYLKTNSLVALAVLSRRPDVNYTEIHGYVGVLPFILALLVFVAGARPGWKFFACAFFSCLLTALGAPVFMDLFVNLPGLDVGDVKRFLFPGAACLSVMAAFTLDAFWKPGGAPRVQVVGFVGILVVILLLAAAWICVVAVSNETLENVFAPAIDDNISDWDEKMIRQGISEADLNTQRDFLSSVLLRTILHMVLAAVTLVLSTAWTRDWPISRPIVVAVLMLDLFAVGWSFNPPVRALPLYDESNPMVHYLKEETGLHRIIRFRGDLIYPVNAGCLHGVYDAQGYTAFYQERYRSLFKILAPGQEGEYGIFSLKRESSLASPLLDLLSIRFVLSSQEIDLPGMKLAGLHERHPPKSVWVYENTDRLPRAYLQKRAAFCSDWKEAGELMSKNDYDPRSFAVIEGEASGSYEKGAAGIQEEDVRIVSYEPELVELDVTGGPGWLILSDPFADGWIAERDGEIVPIHPANLAFRAVEIPDPGIHRVVFRYEPGSVRIGKYMSFSGLLICAVLSVLFWLRSRREEPA